MVNKIDQCYASVIADITDRPVRLPPRENMLRLVRHIARPESDISQALLPLLLPLAGRTMKAYEIADEIGRAYNIAIRSLTPDRARHLMSLLDLYPRAIIKDKAVGRFAAERIMSVFEFVAARQRRLSTQR